MSIIAIRLEKAIKLLSARKTAPGWWTYTLTDGFIGECTTRDLILLGKTMGETETDSEALEAWLD